MLYMPLYYCLPCRKYESYICYAENKNKLHNNAVRSIYMINNNKHNVLKIFVSYHHVCEVYQPWEISLNFYTVGMLSPLTSWLTPENLSHRWCLYIPEVLLLKKLTYYNHNAMNFMWGFISAEMYNYFMQQNTIIPFDYISFHTYFGHPISLSLSQTQISAYFSAHVSWLMFHYLKICLHPSVCLHMYCILFSCLTLHILHIIWNKILTNLLTPLFNLNVIF
jgi:hypothetical protein